MSIMSRNIQFHLLIAASSIFLLCCSPTNCDPHPWADNVCNKTIPVTKDIVIEQPVEYEVKVESMCGLLPCVKIRKDSRIDQTIKTILRQEVVATCCPGYTETPDRNCSPVCLQSCNNGGKCTAPNTCKCQPEPSNSTPGFVGPSCNRFVCPMANKWGSKCDRPCECQGNSFCAANTGKCTCLPGWYGYNCTLECSPSVDTHECRDEFKFSSIIEPDANLLSENLVMERQRSEALVLDDTVKITQDDGIDWSTTTPRYLVVILSVFSLVLIIAFILIKRRYNRICEELYYATNAPSPGDSVYSGSMHPSAYYSDITSTGSTMTKSGGKNFDDNLNFFTATRRILSGEEMMQSNKCDTRKKTIINSHIESHLIDSQKQAKHNVYSDVVLNMDRRGQCEKPTNESRDSEHIYQVPKSISSDVNIRTDHSGDENEDDSNSNIYEEIKPRP